MLNNGVEGLNEAFMLHQVLVSSLEWLEQNANNLSRTGEFRNAANSVREYLLEIGV